MVRTRKPHDFSRESSRIHQCRGRNGVRKVSRELAFKWKVEYKGVNLKYTPEGGRILKDLTFVIQPREKIGVVGRTGAGKSSIISVLYHFYEFSGTIAIDDVDIKDIDVEHLRLKVNLFLTFTYRNCGNCVVRNFYKPLQMAIMDGPIIYKVFQV